MGGSGRAERSCLGCRQVRPQSELTRYVVSPDGIALLIDYRHRLPGRGGYTCPTMGCLSHAVKRNQFQRALRAGNLQVDLAQLVIEFRNQVLQRIENLIGMARKSNQLVSGSNQFLAEVGRGRVPGLVLLAKDVSVGIGDKIRQRITASASGTPICQLFTKEHLGTLLGRDERSVVGIWQGKLSEALVLELQRYEDFAGEI
ncbi:MAG: hypothetical protein C0616_02700 [Desulfuromonas sp.]|nr:MAG: hypothetical protein C0616_02700 [Desulfuromonas sp.]